MDVARRTGSAYALQSTSNVWVACLEVEVVSVAPFISQSLEAFLARLTTDPALGSLVRQQCTLFPGTSPDQALPAFLPLWLTTFAFNHGIALLKVAMRQSL